MKEGAIGSNPKRMTAVLVAIIIILAVVVIYALIIRPAFNGYVTNLQNQGANQGVVYTINTILSQVQQNGYTQIPAGNNQTLTLMTPQFCSQYLTNAATKSVNLSG